MRPLTASRAAPMSSGTIGMPCVVSRASSAARLHAASVDHANKHVLKCCLLLCGLWFPSCMNTCPCACIHVLRRAGLTRLTQIAWPSAHAASARAADTLPVLLVLARATLCTSIKHEHQPAAWVGLLAFLPASASVNTNPAPRGCPAPRRCASRPSRTSCESVYRHRYRYRYRHRYSDFFTNCIVVAYTCICMYTIA